MGNEGKKSLTALLVTGVSMAMLLGGGVRLITTGEFVTQDDGSTVLRINVVQGVIAVVLLTLGLAVPAWASRWLAPKQD